MTTLHTRALTSATKKAHFQLSSDLEVLPGSGSNGFVTPDGADIESAPSYACIIDKAVAPPTANYSVSADVKVRTIVSGNSAGIILRGSGTEKKAYYLQLYADGTLKLQRDGPWNSNLGTASVPLTAGTTYRVEGVIDGNQIWGYVDGVLKIGPITDVAITAAGYPGYVTWADSAGVSDSTGMAVSNLSLDTLGGASPTLVTVANSRQANTASAVSVSQTVGNIASLVTVANSQQANTASPTSIKQTHLVRVGASTQTNRASAVSAGQSSVTSVLIANSQQANTASAAAIKQTHLVMAAASQQANTASPTSIKQTHLVRVANSTQSNAGSAVSAGQSGVTAVLIANSHQANTASAAAIKQTHLVVAAASQQANAASPTSIKQTHLVRVGDSTQTNRASAVAIHVGLPNPDQPGAFVINVVRKTRFDCKIQRKVIFTLGVANRVR